MEKTRKSRVLNTLIVVLVILIVVRLLLPYAVLHYANKTLANTPGYFGHVQDVDLSLYRGAYQIKNIYLDKKDTVSGLQSPFFASRIIDLAIEWKSLMKGRLVAKVGMDKPVLYFVKDKVEPADVRKDTTTFRTLLDKFMPLNINRFEVHHGEVHYVDSGSAPVVNIKMDETYLLAQNLSSVIDSTNLLPSTVEGRANIYGGTLNLNMKLNALAEKPTFDLNAKLENTQLIQLNDFFKAYAKVDVNKGTFGLYTEMAAKNGAFVGYVKPLIKDLDVRGPEDKKDNVFHKLWESVVGTTADIFSNWPKDQFATKIPLKGNIDDPNPNIWITIYQMLKNAFINALRPSLDQDINIATVNKVEPEKKTFLQKIFGGKDSDKKDREEKKNAKDDKKDKSDKKKK